ncbi:uncharacterized protein LOC133924754 isoform X1 [Phragmites australis]|uniref:uncharacterized protein LOC133924754 isoform X1 n=1 Tax=Phragmites australis TaxID=29695 RepID=UPI002D76DDC6|nr:uncharacterized protein LOC133924754 isoform X1 [Phragmites australis]
MAVPVYSITRADIDEFWRRKEVEAEERRLAAEKEAARIKAKELKVEDYVLFEQMIREILKDGNEGDGAKMMGRDITRNSRTVAAAASSTEARIGIKHWWKRSAHAYLNAPALSMDENGRSRHAITYVLQERSTGICSSTPCQPNTTVFVIF